MCAALTMLRRGSWLSQFAIANERTQHDRELLPSRRKWSSMHTTQLELERASHPWPGKFTESNDWDEAKQLLAITDTQVLEIKSVAQDTW
jgi:hypothetical protein